MSNECKNNNISYDVINKYLANKSCILQVHNKDLLRIKKVLFSITTAEQAISRNIVQSLLYNKCDYCTDKNDKKVTMLLDNGVYICKKCGSEKKWYNDEYNPNSQTHNISANSLILFKIVGPDNHRHQKSLLQTSSNYKNYRRGANIREFLKLNKRTHNPLPNDILMKAAELFTDIQDANNIMRADFRFGVWGAFINFECIRANITKKPKEIAAFVGVSEKYLSKGDREVRKWHEEGLVDVPIRSNPLPDFINQYFILLGINSKYKAFVFDMVKRIKTKRVKVHSSSNPSTCVVAIIWILVEQLKLNISHNDIFIHCSISKSTYISYYKLIMANEIKVRKLFKRHNIPIPPTWQSFSPKKKRLVSRKIIRYIIKIPKKHMYEDIKYLL